jgi:hypothetical protein
MTTKALFIVYLRIEISIVRGWPRQNKVGCRLWVKRYPVPPAGPDAKSAMARKPTRFQCPTPNRRPASETLNKFGSRRSHSITSSARSKKASGIVMPSAFAAVRLTTSSKVVGCSTGRSAGFAPFKILSTRSAARRNRSVVLAP